MKKIIAFTGMFSFTSILLFAQQNEIVNGKRQGTWIKKDSVGRTVDSSVYEKGVRVKHTEIAYYSNGFKTYDFTDSLANTYHYQSFVDNKILYDATFKGKEGILNTYDTTGKFETVNVHTRDGAEAEFTGGQSDWVTFLRKNLNPQIPVDNGAPGGTYPVIVRFTVLKDGQIDKISAETSYGYGMEKEVLRIMRLSPKWKPALMFGIPVNAYRRQPVTFAVEEEKKKGKRKRDE